MENFLAKLRGSSSPASVRRFTAIDFDTRSVRIVHAQRHGQTVRVCKVSTVPLAGVSVADADALGGFLKNVLAKLGLSGTGLLLNVPRSQTVLKPITLPSGTALGEMAAMVRYQVEKELPFRLEDAVVDFTPASHFGADPPVGGAVGIAILVAAARLGIVDHYRKIAAAAGCRLLRLGLRPASDMRCVAAATSRQRGESVVFVHLTQDEMEIDVLCDESLVFSRSVAVRPDPLETEAANTPIETIVNEATRSLQSYQAVHRAGRIGGVLVGGGTGLEGQLARMLAERMNLRCEVFNPASAVGLMDDGSSSSYVSALGLCLAQSSSLVPFDFLNPKKPAVQRDKRKLAAAIAGVGLVALCVAAYAASTAYVSSVTADVNGLQSRVKKLQGEKDQASAASARYDSIKAWQDDRQNWLAHWAYLSETMPSCKDVYLLDFNAIAVKTEQGRKKTTIPASDQIVGEITFNIHARDKRVFDEINGSLMEAGYDFPAANWMPANDDKFGYGQQTRITLRVPRWLSQPKLDPLGREPLRPADDGSEQLWASMSSGTSGGPLRSGDRNRDRGGQNPRENSQPPAASNGPTDPAAASYREVRFDKLAKGTADLEKLKGEPVSLRARVGKSEWKFLIAEASEQEYVCIRLEDFRNRDRFVYGYVKKGSEVLKNLEQRAERGGRRGVFAKFQGRMWYTASEPEQCPAVMIVDQVE